MSIPIGVRSQRGNLVQLAPIAAPAAFNPATLAATYWYRDFASSPWSPTASAGASGTNGTMSDATPPTAGSALNGHNGAILNGTTQKLGGATAVSSLHSATAWSFSLLVNPAATAAVHAAGATYADPSVITDDTNGFGPILSFTASGWILSQYDSVSWKETAAVADAGGTVRGIQCWYDGVNLNLKVNSAAAVTVAAGNLNAAGGPGFLRFGANYTAGVWCGNTLYDIIGSNVDFGSTARDNIRSYWNSRYALSL